MATVLLVEDEATLVQTIAYTLRREGYTVVTAGDGQTALTLAREARPDVVVLDLMLPGLDGFEVCDHLLSHERTSRIPIIFLTAKGSVEDQLQGWYRGCFDYIVKPFEVQDLLAAVKRALTENPEEVRRLQEELRRQKIVALEQIVHDGTE